MRADTDRQVTVALLLMLPLLGALSRPGHSQDTEAQERSFAAVQDEPKATIVGMPGGSVGDDVLIGYTGNRTRRKWLAEELDSRDLVLLNRQYTRVGAFATFPYFNFHVWDHEITYKTGPYAKYHELFGNVFPKWRACQGQIAVFNAAGFFTSPMQAASGFFLIPYAPDAREYRCPDWREIRAMNAEDSERFRYYDARGDGKGLVLERAVYAYDKPLPPGCAGDHMLIKSLHQRPCAGFDFVIDADRSGVFFWCEKVRRESSRRGEYTPTPLPENLPSKMVVLDFEMRERKEWIPELDRSEIGRNETRKPTSERSAPQPRMNEDGVVVGMPSDGFASPRPTFFPPDSVVSLRWSEKESFKVPFSLPFTAAVVGDDYFFVTNDGRIFRASPAQAEDAERSMQCLFDNPEDPVIACIHESRTNRIFAFRKRSYIAVDNAHFPADAPTRFQSCEDVTEPQRLTFINDEGEEQEADDRFQLVSRCAKVLYEDGVLESSRE